MENLSKKLTIGQFSRLTKTSEQTLRYYDQIGLFCPTSNNERTGYRYYTVTQCATLDIITHMKSLGISLKEIKTYLETNDIQWLMQTLMKKKESVDAEIDILQNTRAVIERKILNSRNYTVMPKAGLPFIESIPQREIFKYDTGINYYYNADSATNYEYMLRVFKDSLTEQKMPNVYFYNVSSIMRRENLLQRNFITTELFVFIEDTDRHRFASCETIDSNMYLCMICDNCKFETEYINRMLNEIEEKGYIISGDYICEVVSEFLSVKDDNRNMILKLQIPITFQ